MSMAYAGYGVFYIMIFSLTTDEAQVSEKKRPCHIKSAICIVNGFLRSMEVIIRFGETEGGDYEAVTKHVFPLGIVSLTVINMKQAWFSVLASSSSNVSSSLRVLVCVVWSLSFPGDRVCRRLLFLSAGCTSKFSKFPFLWPVLFLLLLWNPIVLIFKHQRDAAKTTRPLALMVFGTLSLCFYMDVVTFVHQCKSPPLSQTWALHLSRWHILFFAILRRS